MTLSQSLCNCLSALGLKQEQVHGLVDSVVRWHNCNGPEWTISRLKDFKQYYLYQLAGEEYEFKSWARRRSNGRPSGPWGSLKLSSKRDVARTFGALNVYTIFVAHSPTANQQRKFLGSVASGRPVLPDAEGYVKSMVSSGTARLSPCKPWSEFAWSPRKRAPLTDGTTIREDLVSEWLPDNGKGFGPYHREDIFRKSDFSTAISSAKMKSFVPYSRAGQGTLGGKVSYLQEPGYKLRGIANPLRMWQILLEPLKEWSFRYLKDRIPEDCTFDQMKGVLFCREALEEGHTVHSVDLSDATNLFPLDYQLDCLGRLLDFEDPHTRGVVRMFARACRAEYKLPDGRPIKWDRGQPLGLAPSFAVFAIAHHSVVRSCQRQVGGDYRILGDDIAIVGDALAKAYKDKMQSLGCVISIDKTLTSSSCAEFAGRIITRNWDIPQIKWRAVSDRNFLDILSNLGPTSLGLLRPRQRRVAKKILELPEWVGGLGWNPKGIPLDQRLDKALKMGLLDDRPEEVTLRSSSSTHRGILNEISYGREEGVPYLHPADMEPTPTTTSGRIPRLWSLLGLSEVLALPELRGGDYIPSVRNGDPRGQTTLDVLERKTARFPGDTMEVVELGTVVTDTVPSSSTTKESLRTREGTRATPVQSPEDMDPAPPVGPNR